MSTLTAATLSGGTGGIGDVIQIGGGIQMAVVPWSVAGSASYATGGDTWTPPVGIPGNWKLQSLLIIPNNLTYYFTWNGSTTTPLIAAFTAAMGTQVTAATNLSTATIQGLAFYTE